MSALNSQFDNANIAFKRASDLLPRGFTTKAAYDQAKTNVDVLAHQMDSMKSQRAVIAQQMTEGEILAPKDGRVLTMSAIPGSVVMPGEAIARIAAGSLFLRLSLPERHASLLELNAPVLLAPHGGDWNPANGGMRKATSSRSIRKSRTAASSPTPKSTNLSDFFIGERVQIVAPVGQRQALLIPRAAGFDPRRRRLCQGDAVGRPDRRRHRLCRRPSCDMVEALTGLDAGDKVVTP